MELACPIQKTGTHTEVRLSFQDRTQNGIQRLNVVLAISVKLHSSIILVTYRIKVASLHRTANSQILHQMHTGIALSAANFTSTVSGPVINDDIIQSIVISRLIRLNLTDCFLNVLLLVEGGNDQ